MIAVGTLTGTLTISNPSNAMPWSLIFFQFTQDGTGGRAVNWSSFWKGAVQPVRNANSSCMVAFMVDGSGNIWCLTPLAIDGNSRIDSSQAQFEGISLIASASAGPAPKVQSSNGARVEVYANNDLIQISPQGATANGILEGTNAGIWRTYDQSAAVRNTLDDGAGNMQIKGVIKNTPNTATMGATLKKGSGGGNYVSASTSYVDVDATNLALTITIPTGWKLVVNASGQLTSATAIATVFVSLLDGSTLVEAQVNPTVAGTAGSEDWALNWVITGDGASHTVKLQYKTSNGADSATILNSSATLVPTMVFTLMPSN